MDRPKSVAFNGESGSVVKKRKLSGWEGGVDVTLIMVRGVVDVSSMIHTSPHLDISINEST